MADEPKTVFISYRRNVASFIARAIFLDLREHGYDVFMDVESIDSGTFDTIILNQIEARAHFLVILTPGTLDRCAEPSDWLRQEIEYAMEKQRNIVPLFVNDFKFNDDTRKYLTGNLAELPRRNGLNVPHDYFEEAMTKLKNRFLKQPTTGAVKPAPISEHSAVQQKIEEIAAQPAPTPEQLSAEEYYNRAYDKNEMSDYEGAIADYSEAIRLNPQYDAAYNNRGLVHKTKNNIDSAHADYNKAIQLNPQNANAYSNRGFTYITKGDFDNAIADCTEALRLNPQLAHAYGNRGIARYLKSDLDGAITDYSDALRLDPQLAGAYLDRGEAYFAKLLFDKALEDFKQANNLQPAYNMTLGGLAITQHALGQKTEAKRLWRALVMQDQRYRDADWVGKQFNWRPELIEAAHKLIAEL